jgi:hypothetical protein
LLPTSLGRWVGEFRTPVETLVAPIQSPIASAVRAVRPKPASALRDDATLDQVTTERDEFRYRYHQSQIEIEQLKQLIADLSGGLIASTPTAITGVATSALMNTAKIVQARSPSRAADAFRAPASGICDISVCVIPPSRFGRPAGRAALGVIGRVRGVGQRHASPSSPRACAGMTERV